MHYRLAKFLMVLSLGAFAFIVTFDNITDYQSNFSFVQHVLSMDTTFPGNALMYRSITTPVLWHAGYWVIIVGEGITCICFLVAAWQLWQARSAPAPRFEAAKKWAVIGATIGFLVWFFGFMVVGGEWFAMWQSKIWNGQSAAFRFYVAILGVLIFVSLPERELDGGREGR